MKKSAVLEGRIQTFMARKVDQYPELKQPFDRMYRDLVRAERTQNDTYKNITGARRPIGLRPQAPRFSSNHLGGLHYAS